VHPFRSLQAALLVLILGCSPKPEAPESVPAPPRPSSAETLDSAPESPPFVASPLPAAADTSPLTGRLLVAVTVDGRGSVTFDPVYYLPTDSSPRPYPPGLDTGVAAFQARYAAPTRPYVVLEGGHAIGALHPTEAYESSCTGQTGTGYITPAPQGPWAGLAITGPPLPVAWHRRDLTSQERLTLLQLARPLLLALEASPAGADSALLDRGFAYEALADSTRLLAAALHHDALRPGRYHERLSVFLIARRDSTGYVPVYSWSHGGVEEGRQVRGFLDAADLDGDGALEFVTSISYYESTTYQVIQANGGEWSPGASAGC